MFSDNIRLLRQTKELNQVQLAQKLNVKKQTISNWENGNIMPSVQMLERIADFFGVSTDYLLGRKEKEKEDIHRIDTTGLNEDEYDLVYKLIVALSKK